jgi:hypothetical protein
LKGLTDDYTPVGTQLRRISIICLGHSIYVCNGRELSAGDGRIYSQRFDSDQVEALDLCSFDSDGEIAGLRLVGMAQIWQWYFAIYCMVPLQEFRVLHRMVLAQNLHLVDSACACMEHDRYSNSAGHLLIRWESFRMWTINCWSKDTARSLERRLLTNELCDTIVYQAIIYTTPASSGVYLSSSMMVPCLQQKPSKLQLRNHENAENLLCDAESAARTSKYDL